MKITWAFVAFLLIAPTFPPAAEAAADAEPTWWGPAGAARWPARVPVTITNDEPYAVSNVPVRLDVNVASLLEGSGWPTRKAGEQIVARGFTLDPDSWRVVEYTNFNSPTSGTDGQPKVSDPSTSGSDAFVVASSFQLGSNAARRSTPYDNVTNPEGTLTWVVPGDIPPGGERYFYAYFSRQEDGLRPPAKHAALASAALDAQYYVSRGTTFIGYGNSVTVLPLARDTSVTVYVYTSSTKLVPHVPPRTSPLQNPFRVSEGTMEYQIGLNPAPFVVMSDRPILARSSALGFVPSLDASLAGNHFAYLPLSPTAYAIGQPGTRLNVNSGQTAQTASIGPSGWARIDLAMPDRMTTLDVTSGQPVLIQEVPPAGASAGEPYTIQIPSVHGAPQGTRLMGAGAARLDGGVARTEAKVIAVDAAAVAVRSDQRGLQLGPRGEVGNEYPPPRTLGDGETWTLPFDTTDPATPIAFTANGNEAGPVLTFLGRSAGGPRSAIGGVGAREFVVPFGGSYFLAAYYNQTTVRLTVDDGPERTLTLNAFNRFDIRPGEGFRVNSSKPIALLPTSAIGYLPGVMSAAPHTLGPVEVRGASVAITSLDGAGSPILRGGIPGGTTVFRFRVENLGRDGAKVLQDDIKLSIEDPTLDWETRVEPSLLRLESGESGTFTVEVDAPPTIAEGANLRFTVRATSTLNPRVHDDIHAIIVTRTLYDVAVTFNDADGPTTLAAGVRPGEVTNWTVAVTNKGSGTDKFDLTTESTSSGYTANLTLDGRPVTNVTLDAGASILLDLQVTTPELPQVPVNAIEIAATSTNNLAAAAKATLTLEVREDGAITIEANNQIEFADPGTDARINVSVVNNGTLPIDLAFNVTAVAPREWGRPKLLLGDIEISEIDELPPSRSEGPLNLTLSITIPASATAFSAARLLFSVAQRDAEGATTSLASLEAVAYANRVMDVVLHHEQAVRAPAGNTTTFGIDITNRGNAHENATLAVAGLPPGWSFPPVDVRELAPNETRRLTTSVRIPPYSTPQNIPARLHLITQTRGEANSTILVQIPEIATLRLHTPERFAIQGHTVANLTITIENLGNSRAPIAILVKAPPGWYVPPESEEAMEPGERRDVTLRLEPPPEFVGDAPLRVIASRGNAQQEANIDLAVQAADVAITRILRAPTLENITRGEAVLVAFVVENRASIDARGMRAVLRFDGRSVDSVPIDFLPAGAERIVTLRALADAMPSDIAVAITGNDGDTMVTDHQIFHAQTAEQRVPTLTQSLVLGAALLLAFVGLLAAFLPRRRRG